MNVLFENPTAFQYGNIIAILIGCLLIYLATAHIEKASK